MDICIKILGTFNKKELQKINKKVFRTEKVINRKGETLSQTERLS